MKIYNTHTFEKLKIRPVNVNDIKTDEKLVFTKDMLRTFDIVKADNSLYMCFIDNAGKRFFTHFKKYHDITNMCAKSIVIDDHLHANILDLESYDKNLKIKDPKYQKFDITDVYVLNGIFTVDFELDTLKIDQESLESYIKNMKYNIIHIK